MKKENEICLLNGANFIVPTFNIPVEMVKIDPKFNYLEIKQKQQEVKTKISNPKHKTSNYISTGVRGK
jgi:hypothetical protein